MALHDRASDLIRIGAYKAGTDAELDRAIALQPAIRALLTQEAEQRTSLDATVEALLTGAADMSARKSMKRLLALRAIEEEREEAELRRQRQLRQICLDALQASHERKMVALRALHQALDSERSQGGHLGRTCACLWPSGTPHLATAACPTGWDGRESVHGMAGLSPATVADGNPRGGGRDLPSQRSTIAVKQKTLDGWFLSSRPERSVNRIT